LKGRNAASPPEFHFQSTNCHEDSAELRRETTVHLTTSSSGSIVRAAPLLDRLITVDTPFAVPMRPEVAPLRHADGRGSEVSRARSERRD
jgi:hypothetical protein